MTSQDVKAFSAVIGVLAEALNEPMSPVRIKAYFEDLADFDLERVCAALRQARRTCKFFPKPVELRELIEGTAEDAAEQAWGAVLREIRRVGWVGTPNLEPRVLRAVNELWGGWQRLCETLPGEGPELVGWIKQFKATYLSVERETARQLTAETVHPNVRAFITSEQKRLAGK